MAMEIMNTGALESKFTSWFFYGKTRTGKTTAAATFPKPLFLQPLSEDSIDSLAGRDLDYVIIRPEKNKTGESFVMGAMDRILSELEARFARAKILWDKGDEDAGNAEFPWLTVVKESVSHYTDMVQEELTRHGMFDMDQQKWGKLSSHMRMIHERLRNLEVHRVYVSLVAEKFDQKGNLIEGKPAFPGGMSMKLPSACGGVVFFDRRPGNPHDIFTAHLAAREKYDAGVRYPKLRGLKELRPFDFAEISKRLGT